MTIAVISIIITEMSMAVTTIVQIGLGYDSAISAWRRAPNGARVREATRDDKDAICALLQQASAEGAFEQMDAANWRHIFDYSWIEQKPDIGFVLAVGAEIVGFLGTIYALREINGKRGLVCNFTSWYVRPAYRGWGTALLPAALREGVTSTSLSPTPNSQQALAMLAFSTLGTCRL